MNAVTRKINDVLPAPVIGLIALLSLMPIEPLSAAEHAPISRIGGCRTIEDNTERLRCYDTISDGGVYEERESQQPAQENVSRNENPADTSVDQKPVTIVRITKGQNRIHYFYTADGTVWRQTGRGSWNLKVPFEARIEAGMLGSFFLVTDGGKSTRVKRVE